MPTDPALPRNAVVLSRKYLRRERFALVLVAFSVGLPTGALLHKSIEPTCAAEPREVSKTLIKIGEGLCKQWEGLRNIERVGEEVYTFTCEKYVKISNLEVWLKEARNESKGGGK